jgi:hypothetical protein
LKNDSEGISEEENTWRYIGGIFGHYFWKEFEGDHWGNICKISTRKQHFEMKFEIHLNLERV